MVDLYKHFMLVSTLGFCQLKLELGLDRFCADMMIGCEQRAQTHGIMVVLAITCRPSTRECAALA